MQIRLIALLFLFFVSTPERASSQADAIWPAAEWTHSEPEAQGMSSAGLVTMLERIENDNPGIRSITVVRHGTVVLDLPISPFTYGDRHVIHSCTKSVLSALVGIAINRGDLPGLDTPVLSFFPDYEFVNLDDDKRAMTLGHLLTMSAGLKTEDSYLHDWVGLGRMRTSPDWAQYILDLPIVTKPGTRFEYSNCVSELIAIILQNATGQSLEAYAREHLFGPIGIANLVWEGSGPGDSWGYSGLNLRPLDMARLGYLYLRGGEWDGKQVVPVRWVQESTSAQIVAGTLANNYGYQWWVGDNVFMMQGYGGQFVYVLPELDLVVVFTGAVPSPQFFTARALLSENIETAVIADSALPPDPTAVARLDNLIEKLSGKSKETPQPMSDVAHSISGRTFEFDENKIHLRTLTLHFTSDSPEAEIEFVVGPAAASLTVGLDGTFRTSSLYGQSWACRGHWENGKDFILEQEAPGKVLSRRITLTFQGDTLRFEVHDRINDSVDVFNATAR